MAPTAVIVYKADPEGSVSSISHFIIRYPQLICERIPSKYVAVDFLSDYQTFGLNRRRRDRLDLLTSFGHSRLRQSAFLCYDSEAPALFCSCIRTKVDSSGIVRKHVHAQTTAHIQYAHCSRTPPGSSVPHFPVVRQREQERFSLPAVRRQTAFDKSTVCTAFGITLSAIFHLRITGQ